MIYALIVHVQNAFPFNPRCFLACEKGKKKDGGLLIRWIVHNNFRMVQDFRHLSISLELKERTI